MGIKGEVHFVKMAGARLLQGPAVVRSRLWDGEIEIATIPDYCAYLRVMSWVDVLDVRDTAAVRARYDEERICGGYEIPNLRGRSEKTVQNPNEPVWFGAPYRTKLGTIGRKLSVYRYSMSKSHHGFPKSTDIGNGIRFRLWSLRPGLPCGAASILWLNVW